jgi:hypothetical protein
MYKKQQHLFKKLVVLPVDCLHLVVPEWIAHTHNAHSKIEFIEIEIEFLATGKTP